MLQIQADSSILKNCCRLLFFTRGQWILFLIKLSLLFCYKTFISEILISSTSVFLEGIALFISWKWFQYWISRMLLTARMQKAFFLGKRLPHHDDDIFFSTMALSAKQKIAKSWRAPWQRFKFCVKRRKLDVFPLKKHSYRSRKVLRSGEVYSAYLHWFLQQVEIQYNALYLQLQL